MEEDTWVEVITRSLTVRSMTMVKAKLTLGEVSYDIRPSSGFSEESTALM
jgi:hypothetical protein